MRLRSELRPFFLLVPTFCLLPAGCGGGQSTTGLSTGSATTNITVAVTPAAAQAVDAGQTVALTAAVANDSGNKGVQWTVSPGGGSVATATGLTNTYTAPATEALNVQVTAVSIADPTKTATLTVNVAAAPAFSSNTPLPMGYSGIAFNSALPATGGVGAKTYSIVGGTLPPGITLSSTGVLSGTATTVGTYTFTAQVVDSAATPVTATATFSLEISTLTINPIQLSGGIVGVTYPTATLTSTAAIGNVTYVLASGSLPPGLALQSNGTISGTPTTTGTSSLTVRATDSGGQTTTLAFSVIVSPKLTFANVTVPPANAGTPIPLYQFNANGGTTAIGYAVAAGSTLPPGLSLTKSGLLSGTPTTAGDYSFVLVATDDGSTTGGATPPQQTATATATLHVGSLTLASGTLPTATAGTPYSTTLAATGGTAPSTYAVTSGTLPAGLTLGATTGTISGTPTTAGSSSFTVTVTDSKGSSAQGTESLTVTAAVTITTSGTLPAGTLNTAYSATLAATGGTAPYTYAVTAGALPAGIALSSTGVLSGTPTAAGTFNFTATATDSNGSTGSAAFSLTVTSPYYISTTAIPNIVPYSPFTYTTNVVGGTAPYTYTVSSGSLPYNIHLNSSTGKLEGTTNATTGTYNFVETVTDANSNVATKALSVTVSTTLSPGANNALLHGSYAYTFTGFTNGSTAGQAYGVGSVGVFNLDGNGIVTGSYDTNTAIGGFMASQTISGGSYRLNADQRGTIVFTANGVVTTLTINAAGIGNGVAAQLKLLEFDDNDPTNATELVGGGTATLQTFTTTALTGNYVFDLKGETPSAYAGSGIFGAISAAGTMTFTPAGLVTGGMADGRYYGSAFQLSGLTGSYTVTDQTLGRGTLSLNTSTGMAGTPTNFVFYVVSPTEIVLLSTDPHRGTSLLLSGVARLQTGTAFTAASLSGTVIGYDSGSDGGDGNTVYPNATYADVYRMVFDGAGSLTLNGYTNQNGSTAAFAQATTTYTVDPVTGRVTFGTSTPQLPPIYLTANNTGVGASSAADSKGNGILRIEPQTAVALTDGTFGFASQQTTTRSYGFIGRATTTNSSLSAQVSINYVLFDQPANERLFTQTRASTIDYTVTPATGLIQLGDSTNSFTGYIINGGKFVTVQVDGGNMPYETGVVFEQ